LIGKICFSVPLPTGPASPNKFDEVKGLNSMSREQILAAIDEEISKLQQVRRLLQSSGGKLASSFSGGKPRAKRVLSAEARQRIAAAQKRRWAKQKREASAK
jgi:hypothetical protein